MSALHIGHPAAPPKEGKRPPLYFAFEYMEHDLSGLLNHPRVKFTRTQIQCYMRQLLTGIAFMHRNKIIHRDIKASNLLLNNQGMLKVGDFGLSRFWNEVNAKAGRYTNKVVTLWYRPPELLMGSTSYDFSVDIWSIGCIFGELLLGKPILQGKTEIEQLQLIFGLCDMPTEETWPGFFKLPGAESFQMDDNFPPHAVDLLEKLLQLDPAKRITAAEAMDHDYFWRVQTCKPRDLPKFCVSSTHEYQSKKRHHEEMAAAAAANGKGSEQHRSARQRGERTDPTEAGLTARTAPTAITTIGTEIAVAVGVVSAIETENVAATGSATADSSPSQTQKRPIVIIINGARTRLVEANLCSTCYQFAKYRRVLRAVIVLVDDVVPQKEHQAGGSTHKLSQMGIRSCLLFHEEVLPRVPVLRSGCTLAVVAAVRVPRAILPSGIGRQVKVLTFDFEHRYLIVRGCGGQTTPALMGRPTRVASLDRVRWRVHVQVPPPIASTAYLDIITGIARSRGLCEARCMA
ncbi:hypothetical protein ON010_g8247 [Phytophthora cinnamomi]|nr:hypothetical protein ON010_g8247 [Phytophthora cinnamomi]